MPRDLPLANGRMLVNFDANYHLRDIYWPRIGQYNQTQGHVNRLGVWVEGTFAWLDAPDWQRTLLYEDDTLVTAARLHHPGLALTLECTDVVDFDRDIVVRKMRVVNESELAREVRVFAHHDWHIDESEGANTVYFDPERRAIVAYKGHCYFLVAGLVGDASAGAPAATRGPVDRMAQWATGLKEVNGQQGTWRDAEDGDLSENPISQGSVDSCVAFHLGSIGPGMDRYCFHWIAAAESARTVGAQHERVMTSGPEALIIRTRNYWRLWLQTKARDLGDLPDDLAALYRRSLLIIRTQIDNNGAIIAATDGDVWDYARDSYAYMWPRDGALVALVMSHAGYGDITSAFFHFCAEAMSRDGYLMHKYAPDGALGSSWHPRVSASGHPELPIQEDETALVVHSLWQHYDLFHEVEFVRPLYRPLVKAAADFMVAYREPHTRLPAASWDLWEERHGIHAYTVAAVYAGLMAASRFAGIFGEEDLSRQYSGAAEEIKTAAREYLWDAEAGRFVRMIQVDDDGTIHPDMTIDASLSGLYQFGMFDSDTDEIKRTMQAVEERLTVHTETGGVARYENDYYHQVSHDLANVPGNPWIICACWLAEHKIAAAQTLDELHDALDWLHWARQRALPSGVLAEQYNPETGVALSVSPLTWSHAEFAGAVRWYAGKHQRLMGAHGDPVGHAERHGATSAAP